MWWWLYSRILLLIMNQRWEGERLSASRHSLVYNFSPSRPSVSWSVCDTLYSAAAAVVFLLQAAWVDHCTYNCWCHLPVVDHDIKGVDWLTLLTSTFKPGVLANRRVKSVCTLQTEHAPYMQALPWLNQISHRNTSTSIGFQTLHVPAVIESKYIGFYIIAVL